MFRKSKRAIVCAHPDDESLFFGGYLIRNPGDWVIICCSIPRIDTARAWKFFQACEVLGARGQLLPFQEAAPSLPLDNLGLLDLTSFEDVLTHNWVGEYGHQHHRTVHQHLAERWPGRLLVSGYGIPATPDCVIHLTDAEMARKMAAIRCYDHVSPTDGKPKSEALVERYGAMFDLKSEPYVRYRA